MRKLTPKRLAAICALAGGLLVWLGHYWIGGAILVASFILVWLDDLKLNP